MNIAEYEKIFNLEDYYWWFVARRKLVGSLVVRLFETPFEIKILDIGCGAGAMLRDLKEFGDPVGADVADASIKFCKERELNRLVQCDAERLGIKNDSFDLVTALDVLEHIGDDELAIRECFRVCKGGGYFISTVPAYKFLWSEHDEALSHKRRYTATALKTKLEAAGFRIEKLSYVITCFFLPILLFRVLRKVFKKAEHPKTDLIILPDFLNKLLICVLDIETKLIRWTNLPAGVSVVCVARKGLQNSQESV